MERTFYLLALPRLPVYYAARRVVAGPGAERNAARAVRRRV